MEISRNRQLLIFAGLMVVWSLVAWQITQSSLRAQVNKEIALSQRLNETQAEDISNSLRHNFHYLAGIPEMLSHLIWVNNVTDKFGDKLQPSLLPYEQRKKLWTQDHVLNDLSRYLAIVQNNLGVDMIHLLDAAGDTVAASNWDQEGSPIGSNFSSRDYFQSTLRGEHGMQFAMGKTTHHPGIYFSSPLIKNGHFTGAIVSKVDMSTLTYLTKESDTFITDKLGVVILARDRALEMHAMPESLVLSMSAEHKNEHYSTTKIPLVDFAAYPNADFPALKTMSGSDTPFVMSSRTLPEYGLTVYTREYLTNLSALHREFWLSLLLLLGLGYVPLFAAYGLLMYLRTAKNAKAILSASEKKLSMTLKRAPDAVLICSPSCEITYANDHAVALLGYSAEELKGKRIHEFVPVAMYAFFQQVLSNVLADDEHHIYEEKMVSKSGLHIPVELNAVQLPDGNIYAAIRDITDRKNTEAELLRSRSALESERQLFHSILNSIPVGVWMVDLDKRIKFVNHTFCSSVGVSEKSFMDAKNYIDVLPAAVGESCNASDVQCLAQEERYHTTEIIPFVDGRNHFLEVTKLKMYDSAGLLTGLIGISVDVTEARNEQVLRDGQAQILELIATSHPLVETLDALVRLIEDQSPSMLGSILLLDEVGLRLFHGVGPSLPEDYLQAINGVQIGDKVGSCGTAAYRKESVYVADIETDPLWEDYKELALQYDLKACWSTPIFDAQYKVVGVFAMYYRHTGLPDARHKQLMRIATQTAAIAISQDRTQHHLRKSEAAFRTLFETPHDAYILSHPEQGFIDVNQATLDLFRCADKQDFLALTPTDVSPELQLDGRRSDEKSLEMMQQAMEIGANNFEWIHKRMDGTEFYADVLLTRTEIEGKKVLHATVRDITRRKQDSQLEQQKLDEVEALSSLVNAVGKAPTLELLFEEAMDYVQQQLKSDRVAIMLIDTNNEMQLKAARGLSEHYMQSYMSCMPWKIDDTEFRPYVIPNLGVEQFQFVDNNLLEEEGIRSVALIPLVHHGRLLGMLMLNYDAAHQFSIGENKLALTIASHMSFAIDRKLAEQQFIDIFEFAPDALVMTDMQATIKLVNRQAEKLFGYSEDELVGQSIEILIPQDRMHERRDMRSRFLASAMRPRPLGAMERKDLRGIDKQGRIFSVELSLSPMDSPKGKMIAVAVRDVSANKLIMDRLRDTAAELELANRQVEEERAMLSQRVNERTTQLVLANKAKDSFLATMSHEIRTPLGGLLGMMELLRLSQLNADQAEMLHMAQNSGKNLLRIVDDILDWSKIEAGKLQLTPRPTSIREQVENVKNTYAQLASAKGVLLHTRLDPKLSVAHLFDPLRIAQILNNFTSNAVKFTHHGDVEIIVELLSAQDGNERVRFSVRDSGIGISKQQQSHLFEQYEQASSETARMYGGTGLGLAICSRLAELMEGTIGVESQAHVGSTFYFSINLPVANRQAQKELLHQLEKQHKHEDITDVSLLKVGEGLLALVVDDHPVNRAVLKQQLEQLGLKVKVADSGIVGLSMWWTGHFDVVITDCHMPGMDGYELARGIREIEQHDERKRVPIIAWTANVFAEEQQNVTAAGMDDLLIKPTELSSLKNVLMKWLGGEQQDISGKAVSRFKKQQIEVEDVASAIDFNILKKFALSPAMQAEMLKEFNIHNRNDIANLHSHLNDGNPEGVARAAHRIKGACRMVGAMQLEGICSAIESAAREGDMVDVQVSVKLDEEVERIEATIAAFLQNTD